MVLFLFLLMLFLFVKECECWSCMGSEWNGSELHVSVEDCELSEDVG
jgi:hypothetical protein